MSETLATTGDRRLLQLSERMIAYANLTANKISELILIISNKPKHLVSGDGSVADICHKARTDCDVLAFVVYTDTQKHLQHM